MSKVRKLVPAVIVALIAASSIALADPGTIGGPPIAAPTAVVTPAR